MKKSVLYSLIASLSMVSAGAYADPVADASSSALTTKGYVDAGLKYVYDSIQGDVEALQETVGTASVGNTPGTGLTGRVESLEETVLTLDNLGTDDLEANKKYVLQTNAQGEGSWSELEVEDTWDPTFLTTP